MHLIYNLLSPFLLFLCIWFLVSPRCIGQPKRGSLTERLELEHNKNFPPSVLTCPLMLFLFQSCLHNHFYERLFYRRHPGILTLTIFLSLFSMMSHEPWIQELECKCRLWGQAYAIYWFLHCVQLWFSVAVSIYCKEKLRWRGVVAVLIGVWKDKT